MWGGGTWKPPEGALGLIPQPLRVGVREIPRPGNGNELGSRLAQSLHWEGLRSAALWLSPSGNTPCPVLPSLCPRDFPVSSLTLAMH